MQIETFPIFHLQFKSKVANTLIIIKNYILLKILFSYIMIKRTKLGH